jgi:hypothetical protein
VLKNETMSVLVEQAEAHVFVLGLLLRLLFLLFFLGRSGTSGWS